MWLSGVLVVDVESAFPMGLDAKALASPAFLECLDLKAFLSSAFRECLGSHLNVEVPA